MIAVMDILWNVGCAEIDSVVDRRAHRHLSGRRAGDPLRHSGEIYLDGAGRRKTSMPRSGRGEDSLESSRHHVAEGMLLGYVVQDATDCVLEFEGPSSDPRSVVRADSLPEC